MAFNPEQFAKGYCTLQNEILLDTSLTTTDLAVYWAVCSFIYGTRTQWGPGYRALGIRAHCSKTTAMRAVERLEARGWLIVHRNHTSGGDQRRRATHMLEVVRSRQAFLTDRKVRDEAHAQVVQMEGRRRVVGLQAKGMLGEIDPEYANQEIRNIQTELNRRSPRVPVIAGSELSEEDDRE